MSKNKMAPNFPSFGYNFLLQIDTIFYQKKIRYSALALVVSKIKVGPTGKTVDFRPLVYF